MSRLESNARRSMFLTLALAAAFVAGLWLLTPRPGHIETLWGTYGVKQFLANVLLTALAAGVAYVVIGSENRRRRVFRVVLWLGVAMFCALMLELPALALGLDYRRIFGAPPGTTWLAMSHGVNARDPELLHVHFPHTSYEGHVSGNLAWLGFPDAPRHEVSVRYDKNGFRNEVDLDRAQVAAIGDSFIEAAIIPLERTVTRRLARALDVEVANLGQAAYGFQQEAAVLRRFALPLQPRVVLWFVFEGNDFRDAEGYEQARRDLDRLYEPPPFKDRSFFRNALFALSRATTPDHAAPTPLAVRRSGVFQLAGGTSERVFFHNYVGRAAAIQPGQWAICSETLLEAKRRCAEADARLLVVLIPSKLRVYRDYVRFGAESEPAKWPLGDAPARLQPWCAANDIDFIDLTQALRSVVSGGEHTYHRDDTHWNERGHAVAADAILHYMDERGWKAELRQR